MLPGGVVIPEFVISLCMTDILSIAIQFSVVWCCAASVNQTRTPRMPPILCAMPFYHRLTFSYPLALTCGRAREDIRLVSTFIGSRRYLARMNIIALIRPLILGGL